MTYIVLELGDQHYNIDMGQGFPIAHEIEFLDLIDTPESYVGQTRLIPRVTGSEDGLEFYQPGIGDLDPKDHHLLDGLTDDDHPLYLRHDGQREITGNLIPDVDDSVSLGSSLKSFKNIWAHQLSSSGGLLVDTTLTTFDCDSVFTGDVDWTAGKGFPRVYEGSVIPSMEDGEWGIWHDTGRGQHWIVLRKGSETHRVELKS